MDSINKNGISVCQAGKEKDVYLNLMPRLRRKADTYSMIFAPPTESVQHRCSNFGKVPRKAKFMVGDDAEITNAGRLENSLPVTFFHEPKRERK